MKRRRAVGAGLLGFGLLLGLIVYALLTQPGLAERGDSQRTAQLNQLYDQFEKDFDQAHLTFHETLSAERSRLQKQAEADIHKFTADLRQESEERMQSYQDELQSEFDAVFQQLDEEYKLRILNLQLRLLFVSLESAERAAIEEEINTSQQELINLQKVKEQELRDKFSQFQRDLETEMQQKLDQYVQEREASLQEEAAQIKETLETKLNSELARLAESLRRATSLGE